jgi:hypothetical protein
MCHNKDSGSLPDFNKFENILAVSKQDEGATFSSLTRISHIHLFGISFIFMFVGIIFSFEETTSVRYKCIAIGMPYVFLIADILSWWLTKLHPMFALLVIIAGVGMGASFVYMWIISMLEMWLYKPVFVSGLGMHYLQWRDSLRSEALGKTVDYIVCLIKKSINFYCHYIKDNALPLLKKAWDFLLSKIKK